MEWRKNHSSQICSTENADSGMGAIVAAGLEECSQTPASQLSALLQVMQVLLCFTVPLWFVFKAVACDQQEMLVPLACVYLVFHPPHCHRHHVDTVFSIFSITANPRGRSLSLPALL